MILYFNPGHETAVLNSSPYYMAPANVVTMQNELSFLPAWYGNGQDVVLSVNKLDNSFYSFLLNNLQFLPKPIISEELPLYKSSEISVWGISPQVVHYFNMLNDEYEINLDIPVWNADFAYLNSREAASECLKYLINNAKELSDDIVPHFYTRLDNVEEAVNNSSIQLLAKAPYSSSGRGLLWLPIGGLTRTERQILHGILKKQGSVSVESVLEKETDFAMEFICDGKGGVVFAGYSLFYTTAKGAYLGNYIGKQENILKEFSEKIEIDLLDRVKELLISLIKEKYAYKYKGCIGVDMMIYKSSKSYKLHPCLEINMRYNMGYLALKLFENHISPNSEGRFYLDFSSKEEEIYKRNQEMEILYPAKFEDRRLTEGYLSLCPVTKESKYRAYILINSSSF